MTGYTVGKHYALDCGAGIGRVTGNLLTHFFEKVDLVEQNPKFLEQAKFYLKNSLSKVGQFYSIGDESNFFKLIRLVTLNDIPFLTFEGLQDFCPEAQKYDVIWCQWVLGHLNHEDLIKFFKNCK